MILKKLKSEQLSHLKNMYQINLKLSFSAIRKEKQLIFIKLYKGLINNLGSAVGALRNCTTEA